MEYSLSIFLRYQSRKEKSMICLSSIYCRLLKDLEEQSSPVASDWDSQTVNLAKRCCHLLGLLAAPCFPPNVATTSLAWLETPSFMKKLGFQHANST